MIFYHTTPDPASPFWLLHFESLTLAKLILHPGGPHVLDVVCDTPPPDEAFREFSEAIEAMGTGFSAGLTQIVRHPRGNEIPVAITLAPLTGTGFATVIQESGSRGVLGGCRTETFTRRLAIGHLESGPIGPIWENKPEQESTRRRLISQALLNVEHTTKIDLESLTTAGSLSGLWLEKSAPLPSAFPS